jgi:hypothetical protein
VEKKGKQKGYVHRLDQVATSFFFTNFPDDIKAADLWPKFAHFGRVREVYIPEKRDKQGRRFGFVKYRDVRDVREQLELVSDIWIGTYKLRVNQARFSKAASAKEKEVAGKDNVKDGPTVGKGVEGLAVVGRSFREALVNLNSGGSSGSKGGAESCDGGGGGVVEWEVEVVPEALARLKGSYVGYLSECREHALIQRTFIMDGYHNLKITPLGHLKVLISSTMEGEVKEVVGTVGWWCTWFEKFEEWSPAWVSNHRSVWLSCYGVPLHA